MKVYLDNCCYNRPYDDQSQMTISLETQAKLKIQRLIKNGQIDVVSSYMLRLENSQNPHEDRRRSTEQFLMGYAVEHIGTEKSSSVNAKAQEIMKTGVKMKDAVHVACAIEAGCQFFISTDKRLLKYQTTEIQMVNPIDYIRLEEDDEHN